VTNAARACVNKYCLVRANLGPIDQTLPGRDRNQRKRGGLTHRKLARLECKQVHIGGNEFSERTLESTDPSHHPKYFIAAFESCDIGTDFFDNSRHVQSKYRWKRLFGMRCFASPDLGIKRIDSTYYVNLVSKLASVFLRK